MKKLKTANLYHNDLIPVSGILVDRYNKCLLKLGFTPTNLTSFSVDGMGWSPEIAEEKNTQFYLNNGDANEYAIIITPQQKGVTLYNPFHSFDKELMKIVFKKYKNIITDITRDAALCVEFDQNIDVFYEPIEVLKYNDIAIKFHIINNLEQAKQKQLKLIETFNKGYNFIDENLHQELLSSAKKYGDLRNRNLTLEKLSFKISSFYTKAFGGVYVLRDFIVPILIFEDVKAYKMTILDTENNVLMYHITQPELIEKLRSHAIIELDFKDELFTKRYNRIKKFIFSSYLENTNHPIKNILQDPILFKKYLNKLPLEIRKKVMGVELYLEKKKSNSALNPKSFIDFNFYVALHKPHSSLMPFQQDLIWQLLINIAPKDVLFLYWYNKTYFIEVFKNLDSSLQDWVIETILERF